MGKDGIITEASHNGRRLTLDPIRETSLVIPARQVESTLPAGFRVEWVSGHDGEGNEFTCSVGAGVGSPWLTFEYMGKGYCVNVRDIVGQLIMFANSEVKSEP